MYLPGTRLYMRNITQNFLSFCQMFYSLHKSLSFLQFLFGWPLFCFPLFCYLFLKMNVCATSPLRVPVHCLLFLSEWGNEYENTAEACRNRIGRSSICQGREIRIAEISLCHDLGCDHNQESNTEWRSPNGLQYLFSFSLALQHCRRESMHLYKINSPHRDVCRHLFVISVAPKIQTR